MSAVMIPVVIFTITTLGLNILLGFAGQISLGTAAFMGVGAYSCYKIMTIFPDLNALICVVLSGVVTAFVGTLFGLPSLRIKGFCNGCYVSSTVFPGVGIYKDTLAV